MEPQDRALATVERIADIHPIPDADAIVRARVRGWDVVVKKGEFEPGDRCVYFEIDTLLPTDDPRFDFLAARGTRTDPETGVTGHVLRTARLRGQNSQGLALPLEAFPEISPSAADGTDVTDAVGAVKWEPPLPAELAGRAVGYLPSWIPRTGQPRVQNEPAILDARNVAWEATEKIDGESVTFYAEADGTAGLGTRKVALNPDADTSVRQLDRQHGVTDLIRDEWPGRRAAVQGEMYGEGVARNPLRVNGKHLAVFSVVVDGHRVPRSDWPEWAKSLSVPSYDLPFPTTVDDALAQVDGLQSKVTPGRKAEGVVWVAGTPTVMDGLGRVVPGSVKVISNSYLRKQGDA